MYSPRLKVKRRLRQIELDPEAASQIPESFYFDTGDADGVLSLKMRSITMTIEVEGNEPTPPSSPSPSSFHGSASGSENEHDSLEDMFTQAAVTKNGKRIQLKGD